MAPSNSMLPGIEASSPTLHHPAGPEALLSALSTLAWYYSTDHDAQVSPSPWARATSSTPSEKLSKDFALTSPTG